MQPAMSAKCQKRTLHAPSHPPTYGVEIRPLLVATIRRLPHRKIDSIFPTPGTVSPRVTRQVPLGPSNTAVPFITSRSVQPSMVVGLVSGTGANFTGACRSRALGPIDVGWCSASFNNLRIEFGLALRVGRLFGFEWSNGHGCLAAAC